MHHTSAPPSCVTLNIPEDWDVSEANDYLLELLEEMCLPNPISPMVKSPVVVEDLDSSDPSWSLVEEIDIATLPCYF